MKFPSSFEREAVIIRSQRVSQELAGRFRSEADTLLKLSQLEGQLEDSLYRALSELRQVQALRKEREEKARTHKAKTA